MSKFEAMDSSRRMSGEEVARYMKKFKEYGGSEKSQPDTYTEAMELAVEVTEVLSSAILICTEQLGGTTKLLADILNSKILMQDRELMKRTIKHVRNIGLAMQDLSGEEYPEVKELEKYISDWEEF